MISGLIAKKIGMTQIFSEEGAVIPVTALEVGLCTVLELKEDPKKKVVVGIDNIREKLVNKPRLGYFNKINQKPKRMIKEFSSSDNSAYEVGQEIGADFFKPGDYVDVQGTSVGKGFQGGMKRWNWSGGPGGHGSNHHRRVGSIGASADPSRVLKGTNMPGQMGNKTVTVQNLRVMQVDADNNIILVKGAVPGCKRNFVSVSKSIKKAWTSLDEKRVDVAKSRNPMKQSKAKAGKSKKK